MTVHAIGFIPEWTFGERLRKARRTRKRCSQREFAQLIGVAEANYAQWENDGNRPRNIVEVAQAVENVTGVSAAWILGLDPGPAGPTGGEEVRRVGLEPTTRWSRPRNFGNVVPLPPRRHDIELAPTG